MAGKVIITEVVADHRVRDRGSDSRSYLDPEIAFLFLGFRIKNEIQFYSETLAQSSRRPFFSSIIVCFLYLESLNGL